MEEAPGPAVPARFACGLGLESGDYVGEDVLDLCPHGQENHDDDDRNKNQDQRVLHHSLAALTNVKTMPGWQLNLLSRDAERDYHVPSTLQEPFLKSL